MRQLPSGRWTWKFDWRAFYFEYTPVWRELTGVEVPCLVMRGKKSSVMGEKDFAAILSKIPKAAGIEMPKVYHHITLDAPHAVAEHLLDFFVPPDGTTT